MNRVVGIDVDNVLFDAGLCWFEWASEQFGISLEHSMLFKSDWLANKAEFNFKKYFPEVGTNYLLDFWHLPNIYDEIVIEDEVTKTINGLTASGYDVVFISHVMGNHGYSKERMLRRHFGGPKMKHIFTEHKEYVKVDYMIDDRYKNLRGPYGTKIYFETPYLDNRPTDVFVGLSTNKWDEIAKYIGDRK